MTDVHAITGEHAADHIDMAWAIISAWTEDRDSAQVEHLIRVSTREFQPAEIILHLAAIAAGLNDAIADAIGEPPSETIARALVDLAERRTT